MPPEVEQQITQEAAATDAARSDAIALLEASLTEAEPKPEDATPEPVPNQNKSSTPVANSGVEDQAETPAPAPTPEQQEENRIAAVIKARKEKAAQRPREDPAMLETRAQQMMREAEERQRKLEERERGVVDKLRSRPIEALRELGIDPRSFFEKAVEDPKQLEPLAQVQARLDALAKQNEELVRSLTQREEDARRAASAAQVEQVKREFVHETFSAGKFPTLKAFYGKNPEALAEKAFQVVRDYAKAGGDPEELSNAEVASFLEKEQRDYYESLRSALEQESSEASRPAVGNVSLSSKDTSTKTSRSKKTVKEMNTDEAREEAIRMMEEDLRGRAKPRT